MNRRAFFLSGLAILCVVLNHMTSWGYTAMFWWTDRYRPVTVPNFDQVGTFPYYVLVVIRQLTVFSVPAFVFVSGFFISYANRGKRPNLTWKMVWARITNLLVPYVVWSVSIFIGEALQGMTNAPLKYLQRLAIGEVSGGYYFVPLLCQLYLLSPLLAPVAKTRGRQFLIASALIQLCGMSWRYIRLLGGVNSISLALVGEQWLPVTWSFFFTLGMVSGFHIEQFSQWLSRLRRGLPVAVIILGVLGVVEVEVVYHSTGAIWTGSPMLISTSLYALTFILCFMAFYEVSNPFSKILHRLAGKSYGIYLLHDKVMELVARVVRQIAPWVLAHQGMFQPVVFAFGLGIPLLFMALVARSWARRFYPYLFG